MASPSDDTHTRLTVLANRLARLTPDWRNQERFHEEKSELRAELRSLANSPLVVKQVTKFVRIEAAPCPTGPKSPAPQPIAAPIPATEPAPAPSKAPITPVLAAGALPVMLNADELAVLFYKTYDGPGGYQARFRKWQNRVELSPGRTTGLLVLTPNDVDWCWNQASRAWKGTFQRRAKKILWRSLEGWFAIMGREPSVADHLPASKGRRAGPPKRAPKYLREQAEQQKQPAQEAQEAPDGPDVP
jgi:hypothetical protein